MTASLSKITETTMGLYERIVNPSLLTRRITLTANHLKDADKVKDEPVYEQLDLFSGGFLQTGQKAADLQEGATTIDRNRQIGGHKA